MRFSVHARDGSARCGSLEFVRGKVDTPAFMPVGTHGTVKAMTPEELVTSGAQIILGNTFHLMLRPGVEIIRRHGGLHNFMQWQGPILTDSGGYQTFSLARMSKISEQGVVFKSPVDGAQVSLSPELAVEIQQQLEADVIMVLDECTAHTANRTEALESMQLSLRWAGRFARLHTVSMTAPCLELCREAGMPICAGSVPQNWLTWGSAAMRWAACVWGKNSPSERHCSMPWWRNCPRTSPAT